MDYPLSVSNTESQGKRGKEREGNLHVKETDKKDRKTNERDKKEKGNAREKAKGKKKKLNYFSSYRLTNRLRDGQTGQTVSR